MKLADFLSHHPSFFRVVLIIAFTVSLGLFVAGFLVPPMGEIDGSVLKAGGILLGFAVVAMIPGILESGRQATIRHGDTELTIGAKELEDESKDITCDD